jgi:hypothetical protein
MFLELPGKIPTSWGDARLDHLADELKLRDLLEKLDSFLLVMASSSALVGGIVIDEVTQIPHSGAKIAIFDFETSL